MFLINKWESISKYIGNHQVQTKTITGKFTESMEKVIFRNNRKYDGTKTLKPVELRFQYDAYVNNISLAFLR